METDGRYMMDNNYRYTLELFNWAQECGIPMIYASSAATYGAKTTFIEDPRYEGPLNVYGYSKFLFDQVLRQKLAKNEVKAPVIGLRYFNVYGPHEQHKGRMASVAFHQFFQFRRDGHVRLFEGCLGYGNGEQERDFVYVDDVIAVNLHFFDKPVTGIYNCGTGRAQPSRGRPSGLYPLHPLPGFAQRQVPSLHAGQFGQTSRRRLRRSFPLRSRGYVRLR